MADDGCLGGIVLIAAIVAGVWFVLGDGAQTIAGWRGQSAYEFQLDEFEKAVNRRSIGSSRDVWLAKNSFGTVDRVALFFGYIDDFAACGEAAEMMNARYPDARYNCIFASQ